MYKWNGIKNNTKNKQQKGNERHFVAFHSIPLPFFLFGFRSVVYHLNVAIYLLYKFVIWCGTFDAMAAEMEEQQLEQETDNERKQKAEQRKRFANKCQYIIFHIFFLSFLLFFLTFANST